MSKFQKGISGNPGGRPKASEDLRELARARTTDALSTLAKVMKDSKTPPAARVSAATALLDRAWGKPTQQIDATSGRMSHEDWLGRLDEIEAEMLAANPGALLPTEAWAPPPAKLKARSIE